MNRKKGTPIKKNTLRISLYAISLLIGFTGLLVGIFYSHNNPQYFFWSLFIFLVLIALAFCLKWVIESERTLRKIKLIYWTFLGIFSLLTIGKIFLPPFFIKEPIPPTFTTALEDKGHPLFSLGKGIYFSLSNKKQIVMGEYIPFNPYIEDNKLFVDVEIYSETGFPPIKISKNKIYNVPSNWDWNSNDIALEIVDNNESPIYQLIYREPFKIQINGIFPLANGVLIASDKGAKTVPYRNFLLSNLSIERIFKYPSWRHRGEYEN